MRRAGDDGITVTGLLVGNVAEPLIGDFDRASNLLLRAIRIEPVRTRRWTGRVPARPSAKCENACTRGTPGTPGSVRTTISSESSTCMRPVYELDSRTPVYAAPAGMRETRNHLAVVRENGSFSGVLTLDDVLAHSFPRVT